MTPHGTGCTCKQCIQLFACPYYQRVPSDSDAVRDGWSVDTCGGCGGEPGYGPTCICPVYGEPDE